MTILIQLLEMFRVLFYAVGIGAILAGGLLLLLLKKFPEKNRKMVIIIAVILVLYGVYTLTFGLYSINKTIMYHSLIEKITGCILML